MAIAVKICGLTTPDAIRATVEAKADYVGFVHFPASPRHIALDKMAALKAMLPANIKPVSVLVDPDDALLTQIQTDYLQLHGNETPERVREIKQRFPRAKIIKAIPIRTADDVAQAGRYGMADMLLFDAKPSSSALPGGNGLAFDWNLLKNREFIQPWMLSGGLNMENIGEAIRQSGARMVDVSSSVESSPGVKDAALISAFVKAARSI